MAKESAGQTSRGGASARGRRWGEKSKFILQFGLDVPAREVVEEAKKHGLSITPQYVYIIRRNAKQKGIIPGTSAIHPQGGTVRRGRTGPEQQFRKLALEIGLTRAEELIRDLRARVDRLVTSL